MTRSTPKTYTHICDVCKVEVTNQTGCKPRNWHVILIDGEWAPEIKEDWCEKCVRKAHELLKAKHK